MVSLRRRRQPRHTRWSGVARSGRESPAEEGSEGGPGVRVSVADPNWRHGSEHGDHAPDRPLGGDVLRGVLLVLFFGPTLTTVGIVLVTVDVIGHWRRVADE